MNDPTRKRRGFTYAGDCGDFAPEPACKHFALDGFYALARTTPPAEPHSDVFRQVITVYVAP